MNTRKAGIAFFSLMMVALLSTPVFADDHIVDLTDVDSDVKEVEVTSRGLSFDIEEIRVNVGDTVRVTYVNGGGRHDWVLDEFDGAQTEVISGGNEQTIEFVADQAGSFEFYCSVPGHRQAGMFGRFVVVD
jgi:nitrite reductase (NO-forming)